jgi:hypothetical protein
MGAAETIIELVSPNGNVLAAVEQDTDCAYFYLFGSQESEFGMRSCWVRNLKPAPAELDIAAMNEGRPPRLPRPQCKHPQGAPPLEAARLRIVWAATGDGAALYEDDELLATIPSWSGLKGFDGYARDCIGQTPVCWELGASESNAQHAYFAEQDCYWKLWDNEPGPWPDLQKGLIAAYESRLGPHSKYYGVDGGNWPPKAIVRFDREAEVILITVGVSLRPQPKVEMHPETPKDLRRIELGVCLAKPIDEATIMKVGAYVSGQSGYPWSYFTFLADGHTMPADAFANATRGEMSYVLFQNAPKGAPTWELPTFLGDAIRVLWMLPIRESERQVAEDQGSAELIRRLEHTGIGWRASLSRPRTA